MAVRVIFNGPAARAGAIAQQLREAGLEVSYEPPEERRSVGVDLAFVTFYVGDKILDAAIGVSVEAAVRKAVDRIKDRWPHADVRVEQDDDEKAP